MYSAWLFLLCVLAPTAWAQGAPASPPPELGPLVDRLTFQHQSRYLVNGATCQELDAKAWSGYEGLPAGSLRQCRYTVTSCHGLSASNKTSCLKNREVQTPKTATVVLYEPGPERLAQWIIEACAQAGGNQPECIDLLYHEGQRASGWQIPIAGLVFEDMGPRYVHYAYAFRDGVTVRADAACSWKNGQPDGERAPTQSEDTACSSPQGTVVSTSDKIRPLSTTRADLLAWQPELASVIPQGRSNGQGGWRFVGEEQVRWRAWIRQTMIKAVSSESNPFFLARAATLHREGKF